MGKTKAFTKRHLRRFRARNIAEAREDERTAFANPAAKVHLTRRQQRQDEEMEKMMKGVANA